MKVEHAIHIEAPADSVWAVTADINNWPDWTPTVEKASRQDEGPFRLGSYARMQQPGMPEAIWTVTAFEEGRCFVWEADMRGIHFTATHHVTSSPNGCTNTLGLEMKSVLAFLLWPFAKRQALRTLETENKGLKEFCERQAAR